MLIHFFLPTLRANVRPSSFAPSALVSKPVLNHHSMSGIVRIVVLRNFTHMDGKNTIKTERYVAVVAVMPSRRSLADMIKRVIVGRDHKRSRLLDFAIDEHIVIPFLFRPEFIDPNVVQG